MSTPALKKFLESTGHTVHHLNTIVVGLSGVESGRATKPESLDVSWSPADVRTSSRQARQFLLRSTMVFTAGSVSSYVETAAKYPTFFRPPDWGDKSNAERLVSLNSALGHPECHELVGTLLLMHWRNRIVHASSNASLSSKQRDKLGAASEIVRSTFKNLDVERLLRDFKTNNPTLKETSSLIAMSIRLLKRIDSSFPVPETRDDLEAWLRALSLADGLARAQKTAQSSQQKSSAAETYLRTHCPFLVAPYKRLIEGT